MTIFRVRRTNFHTPICVCAFLDKKNGQEIMKVLKKLNAEGKTIIMVTHDMKLASECSRNVQIQDGEIVLHIPLF